MKKIAIAIAAALLLCGCEGWWNKQIFDFNQKFTAAYCKWPDGTMRTIRVAKWNDYQNSDQIQIIDTDGNVYLFHAANVVLANQSGEGAK